MSRRQQTTANTRHSVPVSANARKTRKSAGESWAQCDGQGALWSRPQLSKARTWKKKG